MSRAQEMPTLKWLKRMKALPIPADVGQRGAVRWQQQLHGMLYWFEIAYNDFGHFFVLAFGQGPDEYVRTALSYGWNALGSFQPYLPEEVKGLMLVPFDPGWKEAGNGITRNNLGKRVKVYYGFSD